MLERINCGCLILVVAGALLWPAPRVALAQSPPVVSYYYPVAPAVAYVPEARGLFGLRTVYRPVLTYPVAPAAALSAPAAPLTTYYAPPVAASVYYAPAAPVVTSYYAPAVSYYPPAAPVVVAAPPVTVRYVSPPIVPTVIVP